MIRNPTLEDGSGRSGRVISFAVIRAIDISFHTYHKTLTPSPGYQQPPLQSSATTTQLRPSNEIRWLIEILLLDSWDYLQTFINLSFHTSAITNIDYTDVMFFFISLLALYSVTFCSTEIKAFDWLIDWLIDWFTGDLKLRYSLKYSRYRSKWFDVGTHYPYLRA